MEDFQIKIKGTIITLNKDIAICNIGCPLPKIQLLVDNVGQEENSDWKKEGMVVVVLKWHLHCWSNNAIFGTSMPNYSFGIAKIAISNGDALT